MSSNIEEVEPRGPMYWHLDFIVALARAFRPRVYVELGVRDADLFNRMIPLAEELIGVDINPSCEENILPSANTRFVAMSTQEFASELRQRPVEIDMLFIDADHSAESVARDFRDYFPFVRPHGLILMHDTHPGDASLIDPALCGDGYLAIDELGANGPEYEMMTIPSPPGLTICRKRTTQLSWHEPEAVEPSTAGR